MVIKITLTTTVLLCATNLVAQNVGIGTNTPLKANLQLTGMVGNTTALFGSDGNGVSLTADWPGIEYNSYVNNGRKYINNGFAFVQVMDPATGYFYFLNVPNGLKDAAAASSSPAITIAPNGRVRIGVNAGFDAQLDVARDAGKDATAFFAATQFTAFNYGAAEHTYIRGATTGGKIFLNYYPQNTKVSIGLSGSYLGINSGDPVYPLEIRANDFGVGLMRMGSENHWLFVINFNYLKLFFRSSVSNNTFSALGLFDYNNGQYSATSDRRLKKQIEPLPPTLEKLMVLQPYRYRMKYNNPNNDETIGLIAQDVKQIFPWLVHTTQNAKTGYDGIADVHTMSYSGLAPIVIKALQEQQAQLDNLEKRIAAKESKDL